MSLGSEGLLAFVLFVFPGVVARAEARRGAAIPEDRVVQSWMRELADALSYSAFLAPLAGAVAVLVLWASTAGAIGLIDLLVSGLGPVVSYAPIQTLTAGLVYVYVAFSIAWYVGGSRRASKIRAWLEDRFKFGQGLVDEPIWWQVMEFRARQQAKVNGWAKNEVFVNVPMAGGGRYTGVLLYFSVASDTEDKRDFAIWKAHYYSSPDSHGQVKAFDLPPDDVVLLNSRDCVAIEVRYAEGGLTGQEPVKRVAAVSSRLSGKGPVQ